ncbi:uncharacterized protein LOC128180682 [Crassostrea angulata]|uniref:uncharacterized protein LOC128180682 n=1 Tax=Magallana angulata TaxID=2784310 RepID=UPI0022B12154|nr:uncharacterized protein LOC128180682 [Crassostrea angulata]
MHKFESAAMEFQAKLCIMFVGIICSTLLQLLDSRKLDGYAFPVYSTEFCPRNRSEWEQRSSAISCTDNNGYMCLPNENRTELLEFCYLYRQILIENDLCLFLIKRYSRVDAHNCRNFRYGCPDSTYFSSEIFKYPSCSQIENGCFLADSTCKSHIPEENVQNDSRTTTYPQETTEFMEETTIYRNETTLHIAIQNAQSNDRHSLVTFAAFLGVLIPIIVTFVLYIFYKKRRSTR